MQRPARYRSGKSWPNAQDKQKGRAACAPTAVGSRHQIRQTGAADSGSPAKSDRRVPENRVVPARPVGRVRSGGDREEESGSGQKKSKRSSAKHRSVRAEQGRQALPLVHDDAGSANDGDSNAGSSHARNFFARLSATNSVVAGSVATRYRTASLDACRRHRWLLRRVLFGEERGLRHCLRSRHENRSCAPQRVKRSGCRDRARLTHSDGGARMLERKAEIALVNDTVSVDETQESAFAAIHATAQVALASRLRIENRIAASRRHGQSQARRSSSRSVRCSRHRKRTKIPRQNGHRGVGRTCRFSRVTKTDRIMWSTHIIAMDSSSRCTTARRRKLSSEREQWFKRFRLSKPKKLDALSGGPTTKMSRARKALPSRRGKNPEIDQCVPLLNLRIISRRRSGKTRLAFSS